MEKFYTSLGLMSGTSMDGVDASVIKSDGENNYEPIFNKYFEYDEVIYSDLLNLRGKINSIKDLTTNYFSNYSRCFWSKFISRYFSWV